MRLPRFFHFQRERSRTTPSTGSGNVGAPAPKASFFIPKFLRSGRSRPHAPSQADSSSAINVASSSLPSSLNPALGGPADARQDIADASSSPPRHSSPPTSSVFESNTTRELDPHSSVTPSTIHVESPLKPSISDARQRQVLSDIPQPPPTTVSPQSFISPRATTRQRQHSPPPLDGNSYQTHINQNIAVDGNENNVNYTSVVNNKDNFMEKLLKETIQGAAFDSSARDPPPRCHPGTRLAVIDRCQQFIAKSKATNEKHMLWVVGQAGVGKSAIMQNVAESSIPSVSERAAAFLSINGRNDGAKIVMTLVYQLAEQSEQYRQFVEHEITRHPALIQSSMSVQFKKLLVDPFINTSLSTSVGHVLIIIDGLDECDKRSTQRELLRLICDVCSMYDSSPFVWIIASRPEAHITSFFDQDHVKVVHEIEEIEVDSDEARSDVEKFLRAELKKIHHQFSLSPQSQWPPDQDFWKLAGASGGLFAFAQTVVKYIGDPEYGDPISQLNDVLKAIDSIPLLDIPREQHPFALLDALYARILSKVPERIMVNTRRILLALVLDSKRAPMFRKGGFLLLCNWLGMTCDEAYAAIRHLGSVLSPPKRNEAHEKKLQSYHKSFIDYVFDFSRSGFSSDVECEARELEDQYTTRILKQAPNGISCAYINDKIFNSSGRRIGHLANVPGAGSDIVVTWSPDEDSYWSDNETRLEVYKRAFANVVEAIKTGHSVFCTESYIRIVINQLQLTVAESFPYRQLVNLVFEESRRREFMMSGMLKRVPVKELDFTRMTMDTILRFRRTSGTTTNLADPWNPSCKHERAGQWGEGEDEDWTTVFPIDSEQRGRCHFCLQRLEQQLENWKTRFPAQDVVYLFTSFQVSFVEFQFIDPDEGMSTWTYWLTVKMTEGERRKLESAE